MNQIKRCFCWSAVLLIKTIFPPLWRDIFFELFVKRLKGQNVLQMYVTTSCNAVSKLALKWLCNLLYHVLSDCRMSVQVRLVSLSAYWICSTGLYPGKNNIKAYSEILKGDCTDSNCTLLCAFRDLIWVSCVISRLHVEQLLQSRAHCTKLF